jgi:hypothetical protein
MPVIRVGRCIHRKARGGLAYCLSLADFTPKARLPSTPSGIVLALHPYWGRRISFPKSPYLPPFTTSFVNAHTLAALHGGLLAGAAGLFPYVGFLYSAAFRYSGGRREHLFDGQEEVQRPKGKNARGMSAGHSSTHNS